LPYYADSILLFVVLCTVKKDRIMKKNILCIDDSNTALIILEYALNKAGFQAVPALGVEEAIQLIGAQMPDMILLDLSMPDISGYDFLKMRETLKIDKVPIIAVSAYDSPESIKATQDLGAIDFVSKPIKIEALIKIIKQHFNQ
jgi:DNA-binding response OmpR family regulator